MSRSTAINAPYFSPQSVFRSTMWNADCLPSLQKAGVVRRLGVPLPPRAGAHPGALMKENTDDYPVTYLLYALSVLLAMGLLVGIAAFILL